MTSSVELRLPLLDYRLVETVIGLRKNYSDYQLPPKAWFKQSIEGLVPDWVVARPKRGFEPPRRTWHKMIFSKYGGELEDGYLVRAEILRRDRARSLAFGPFPLEAGVPLSFKALVLELWCRRYSSLAESEQAASRIS
jgi:asparagine synthase (glutamine-hydrolysing)